MGIHRYKGRSPPLSNVVYLGDPAWTKCECGKYKFIKTGEHIEVKEMSWTEILELTKCEDSE